MEIKVQFDTKCVTINQIISWFWDVFDAIF
uniref:Uncharacterized protein n=1 Tax=Arundo donax TaxID=35708 RepID=A0A0A9CH66_ARUDO